MRFIFDKYVIWGGDVVQCIGVSSKGNFSLAGFPLRGAFIWIHPIDETILRNFDYSLDIFLRI